MKRSGSIFLTLTVVMGLCGVLPILAIEDNFGTLAFFNIFGKQQKEDWKTADEMKGLVDDRLYEVMQCYAAMRTNESVITQRLGPFFSYQVKLRTEPVFSLKNNTVYVRDRTTAEAGRLITWGYRLGLLQYPGGMSYPLPFEARCLIKINETHYRLTAVFYEDTYLMKTVVMSAETPKDYKYPRDYLTQGWFRKEEHSCRILSLKHANGTVEENPRIPCLWMNYYWDRFNPLAMGFAVEMEKLIQKEGLPKNAAIPIATKLTATLVKYPKGNNTARPVLFDPATKSFTTAPDPLKPGEIVYNEDAFWWNLLRGEGYCSAFVALNHVILRYLGLDVYDVGVDIIGAHAVLGVEDRDMQNVKGVRGSPVIVTVERDDGVSAKIHVLEVTEQSKPVYVKELYKTKHMDFIQYNPI
jgi:hypothetical protein